jgi:hypothetical protein
MLSMTLLNMIDAFNGTVEHDRSSLSSNSGGIMAGLWRSPLLVGFSDGLANSLCQHSLSPAATTCLMWSTSEAIIGVSGESRWGYALRVVVLDTE